MLESVRRKSLLSAFFGQHLRSVTPGNIKIRVVRIADTALRVFFQLVCGTFLKNSPDRCSYFLDQLRRDNLSRSIISLLKFTYHSILIKYIIYQSRLNGRIKLFFYVSLPNTVEVHRISSLTLLSSTIYFILRFVRHFQGNRKFIYNTRYDRES